MQKPLSKLEVKDIATIEIINQVEVPSSIEFEQTKEKLSNLKNDAAETAECLAAINTRIKDHLEKMEKLKNLDLNPI
jgi:RNAse (barnase) inhibitor barstar